MRLRTSEPENECGFPLTPRANQGPITLCPVHVPDPFCLHQILLVPGTIKDSKNLKASLIGTKPFLTPWQPTQWLYKFAWMCRRFDRDIMELPRWLSPADTKMYGLPGPVQVLITFLVCVFGAAPDIFPTFIPGLEQRMLNWMVDNPGDAVAVFVCHALVSVGLIRWLFHYVLDPIRFRQNLGVEDMPRAMHGMSEAAPSSSNTPKQVRFRCAPAFTDTQEHSHT